MKERISVTLDRDILKQIDSKVGRALQFHNRSEAIEIYLKSGLKDELISDSNKLGRRVK